MGSVVLGAARPPEAARPDAVAPVTAPEDDEEETEEERLAIEEAREDIKAGNTVSFEEVKKRFGLSS